MCFQKQGASNIPPSLILGHPKWGPKFSEAPKIYGEYTISYQTALYPSKTPIYGMWTRFMLVLALSALWGWRRAHSDAHEVR